MLYALGSEQMRTVERRAVSHGVASLDSLMRSAGEALGREAHRRVPGGPVLVCCGPGNNGGDGWVAARVLTDAGRDVRVLAPKPVDSLPAEAAAAAREALSAGVATVGSDDPVAVSDALSSVAVIVDAIFGFGFHGPAREPYAGLVAAIGSSDAFVVSADVPSGIDSDTGAVSGAVVRADVTVTFSAPKPGLFMYPGAAYAGEVVVADIGIPHDLFAGVGAIEIPGAADLGPLLPVSLLDAHKGSRGRVAVVAGSGRYPGAALLAVEGALRMGAGYVVAVVPRPIADLVHGAWPSALVRAVPAAEDGSIFSTDDVLAAVADADAVVAGPGLSAGSAIPDVVLALLDRVGVPVLLDADALDAIGSHAVGGRPRRAPLVITPHPGEAARMLGSTPAEVQADRVVAASKLSREGTVCLLKGARTIVAGQGRTSLITAGNAGLARAGSGDVLAGMLGTLLAQGVPAFDAAVLGAFLHGRAAEYGTAMLTETCFTSADIATFLPDAVREVLGE